MKAKDRGPAKEPQPANETPIVSLDQIREKRRQRKEVEEAAELKRQREHFRAQQDRQRALLQEVIAERRMFFSDLVDMIKLGIVSDEEDLLPCEAHERDAHHRDWASAYYGEDAEDPDEDLIQGLLERLRGAGVNRYELQRMEESRHQKAPPPNKVYCPLMCYDDDEDPPCAHALNHRYTTSFEDGEMKTYRIVPDADDEVLRANLHPCVFLGRELLRVVMPGAWKLEAQQKGAGAPAEDDDDDDDDDDEERDGDGDE